MKTVVWLLFIAVCVSLVSSQQTMFSCENCAQFANCRLPNCSCCGTSIPGDKSSRPQIVFFSFDDAVTVRNYPLYVELFNGTRLNPNGCPISMTLFVSHNNTDYRLVKSLYDKGMDIAVHGINHIRAQSIQQFTTEALGQRHNIATEANIPENEIVGYRSPYLIAYGSEQFEILQNAGLQYDSTLTITKRSLTEDSPVPFTLDNGWPYPCSIPTCPTRPIPGFWELPVVSVIDRLGLYPCVYVDGCINEPLTEEESYNFLLENFRSYYNKNKAPFGLNMHSTWLLREYETNPYRMRAMHRFLDYILSLNDVYVVNMKKTMQWMKQQPPLREIQSFLPFQCYQPDAYFTMASGDTPTGESLDLETIQKHSRVQILRPDSTPESFGEGLQQRAIKGIRHKRSSVYDMPAKKNGSFKTGPETGKKHKLQITNPLKKNNSQTNVNNRKVVPTKKQDNVFRLMAKLTISNITEKSIRIPTSHDRRGSDNAIVVNPVHFSQNQILVDPKSVDSGSRGRVFFINNKNTARRFLNNVRTSQQHQSGSEASNSGRKLNRLTPNLSKAQKITKPSSANLLVPPMFVAPKRSQLFSLNTKSNRPSLSGSKTGYKNGSKTYSAGGFEKSVGISHTFTGEIPAVNHTSTRSKTGSKTYSAGGFDTSVGISHNFTGEIPAVNHTSTRSKTESKNASKIYSDGGLEKAVEISHTFTGEIPTVNHTSTRECKQQQNCRLPDCLCQDFTPSILPNQIPQFVYITYEGSVNESITQKLLRLFTPQRTNWDGCRIKGTVFVTSEGSNYTSIRKLHDQRLEIGLHGLKAKTLASKLHSLEVAVQKYLLKRYAGIPENDIKGWRSAGLQSRGDDQFTSLKKSKLLYDASLFVMTNLDNRTGMWPFTLDFGWQNNCMLQDCPTQAYPSLWEVPAVPYVGIKKRYLCKYIDSCYNQPRMSVQTYDFLLDNFMGIYKGDRKPFGVRIRSDWLTPGYEENFKGLDAFIELLQELPDVYVVSINDLINWMKDPVPHLEGEPTPEARKISC